ncbi:hypothetical protein ONS95_002516 [Cadophora gregata]|uniref:uncharacterized protein n=1 Tax=Cadophora gregata TaxID=51156 RepID=UPI0026DD7171|nr:uncharacterized protein ONS95_002516 [Cadophora gregata]KAK0109846.1 hypothetical protein ONS95_002516 [Cadophora gregata]KAK0110528.1 hypothetical protein ONS96_002136 [Cadophora gregata f. sp. sojae]
MLTGAPPTMTSFPPFHDKVRFPAFLDCPVIDSPADPADASYYLLGTIAENMTVSAAPTFILKDRNNVSFALTLRIPADEIKENLPGGGFDARGFKKGFTAVVEGARRSGAKEEKAGFVVAPSGSVKIIPASYQRLIEMTEVYNTDLNVASEYCRGCCTKKPNENLSSCTGCRCVYYCNKKCQVVGWQENNHKTDCKILKACQEIFPKIRGP